MTNEQKTQIIDLRKQGNSLAEISDKLGLPTGTVKSFWRRHCVSPRLEEIPQREDAVEFSRQDSPVEMVQLEEKRCKRCGAPVSNLPHHRQKLFCSDKCRLTWWHENRHLAKGAERRICPACGATFTDDRNRKYCSHSCYIKARYA